MSGFCGFTGPGDGEHTVIKNMAERIVHRGPYGADFFVCDEISMSARIDFTGSEFLTKTSAYVVVFDGELYNFETLKADIEARGIKIETETEVLIHLYEKNGEKMLHLLRGPFAFLIYDRKKGEIFAARDSFGIKPLYYGVFGGEILFSSEIKSFQEHPGFEKKLNRVALEQYLSFQYSVLSETFFSGVFKLPPAHFMRAKRGAVSDFDIKVSRWWQAMFEPDERVTLDDAAEEIDAAVSESVKLCARADFPVGALLSGGVDSSYIGAAARPRQARNENRGNESAAAHSLEAGSATVTGGSLSEQRVEQAFHVPPGHESEAAHSPEAGSATVTGDSMSAQSTQRVEQAFHVPSGHESEATHSPETDSATSAHTEEHISENAQATPVEAHSEGGALHDDMPHDGALHGSAFHNDDSHSGSLHNDDSHSGSPLGDEFRNDNSHAGAVDMFHGIEKTFTVGFENAGFNEIEQAAAFSEEIGVEHISKIISADEFWQVLPDIQYYMDEPLADPAAVAQFFACELAKEHVPCVLSGEGADEFFGGYTIYHEPISLAPITRLPRFLRKFLGAVARRLPNMKGKNYLIRASKDVEERFIGNAFIFSEEERFAILRYPLGEKISKVTKPVYDKAKPLDDITKMQFADIHLWLAGDILHNADRMAAANSISIRVPYLDKIVFDAAAKLPVNLRVNKTACKYAFRKAAARHFNDDKKRLGFPVPTRQWLREEKYAAIVRDAFDEDYMARFFHTEMLHSLLDRHISGKEDNSRKIWTVFIFATWYREFFLG
ncbi:MAG: asparagine synthase-related protein [Defluviitaleaceae bacterium]|nr:asparagine synthase-related protein [Defluviitaleaceae bacterium]